MYRVRREYLVCVCHGRGENERHSDARSQVPSLPPIETLSARVRVPIQTIIPTEYRNTAELSTGLSSRLLLLLLPLLFPFLTSLTYLYNTLSSLLTYIDTACLKVRVHVRKGFVLRSTLFPRRLLLLHSYLAWTALSRQGPQHIQQHPQSQSQSRLHPTHSTIASLCNCGHQTGWTAIDD